MADNRAITITLKLVQDNEASTKNQTDTKMVSSSTDNDAAGKASYAIMVKEAIGTVSSEIASWATYYWNRNMSLSDDYIGQRYKQVFNTQINRLSQAASRTFDYAALGAKIGGPVGAAIGALVGVGLSVAEIAKSNIQGRDQQEIRIAQMNFQLSYTRSRAGWSTKAASIGEDL